MFLPKPVSEKTSRNFIVALVEYFSLNDYGIVWNDGERVIPDIWMLHPDKRFIYFAHLALYEFATRFIQGKRVLDFGCGVGYGSYYFASRGAHLVIGIDIDEASYSYACDRYPRENLGFDLRSVEDLAIDPNLCGQFDFVYCSNVMEHIPDYMGALKAVKMLLTSGGKYLQITPPSGKARDNPYHVTNFTVPEWREILLPLFPNQRYFAHIPTRKPENINNEFDFRFEECGPTEMLDRGSISGMILCEM